MVESVWHVFIDCDLEKSCWQELGVWGIVDKLCFEVESGEEFFLKLLTILDRGKMELAMSMVWAIWNGRNKLIWEGIIPSLGSVITLAKRSLTEWQEVRVPQRVSKPVPCKSWHVPDHGYMKINVDAGFFNESMETGVGMIIRDSMGVVIACRTLTFSGLMSVNEGEAWGVLEAIRWAINMNFNKVIIESDAKRIVDAFEGGGYGVTTFGEFIKDGLELLKNFPNFCVSWVCRDANAAAHSLARRSIEFGSPYCWVDPSDFVDGLLQMCTSCI